MIPEADALRAESECFNKLLEKNEEHFGMITQFKSWSINDVVQHIHYFNVLADHAIFDRAAFETEYGALNALRAGGSSLVRATDVRLSHLTGDRLRVEWLATATAISARWSDLDPSIRAVWAGREMSVRSLITSRLMETWAHAQAVYDILGVDRISRDRIKGIAALGVSTFGWSFRVRKMEVPAIVPHVALTSPSGEIWRWGPQSHSEIISGSAEAFCQVVTQVRNIKDVRLNVVGDVAQTWMENAQCFAGAPQDSPPPGTRFRI